MIARKHAPSSFKSTRSHLLFGIPDEGIKRRDSVAVEWFAIKAGQPFQMRAFGIIEVSSGPMLSIFSVPKDSDVLWCAAIRGGYVFCQARVDGDSAHRFCAEFFRDGSESVLEEVVGVNSRLPRRSALIGWTSGFRLSPMIGL